MDRKGKEGEERKKEEEKWPSEPRGCFHLSGLPVDFTCQNTDGREGRRECLHGNACTERLRGQGYGKMEGAGG